MHFLIRIFMLFCCLLYAAMPAQAALGILSDKGHTAPMSMAAQNGQATSHDNHQSNATTSHAPHDMNAGDPCPHRGNIGHAVFCAACVVVVPQIAFGKTGKMLYAFPRPDLEKAFVGEALAPPLPPPRA